MKKFVLSLLIIVSLSTNAQVGIGVAATDVAPSAQLEVKSTTQGFLPPRMTTNQVNAISNPAAGLMLFNSSTGNFMGYSSTSSSTTLQQLTNNNGWMGLGYSLEMGRMGSGSNVTLGQTFTIPNASTLNSIQVYLNNVSGGQSSTVTISVYSGSLGAAYTTVTFSNPIATSSQTISNTGNITFDFTPISLVAGNYYFNITCDNENYKGGANLAGGFTDTDANGSSVNEAFFQTQGQSTSSGFINSKNTSQSLYFIIGLSNSSSTWINLAASSAVDAEVSRAQAAEATLAPKASPSFTGTPVAPTASAGDSSTQLATTAFVANKVSSFSNTTMGSIAGNSTPNGGSISSGVLSLAPADGTNGGIVTNGTQTIAGSKTFNKDIIVSGLTVGLGAGSQTYNTALGLATLPVNTTGNFNTGAGAGALYLNTTGSYNAAYGTSSLTSNTTGEYNTAAGPNSLTHNTTGSNNTATGFQALDNNTSGSNNTAIGYKADVTTGSLTNTTAIGYQATVNESNKIQLGNTYVTSVNTSATITGAGFKTPSGTSSQYLKADGSTSTLDLSSYATTSSLTDSLARKANVASPSFTGTVTVGGASSTSSAVVEVSSTTKGFLPPRMTASQRDSISSPVAGLVLWCTNCGTKGELEVYNGTTWTNMVGGTVAAVPHYIGEAFGGGIVAYILTASDPGYDANVQHGLIAATSDQSAGIQWYNGAWTSTGVRATELGTGFANTNAIIASQGPTATNYAAGLARAYNGGGYNDWYLPSKDELNKLYLSKNLIGGFTQLYYKFYWTSSEYEIPDYAWLQEFGYGNQYAYNSNAGKYKQQYVRAVRSF